VDARTGRSWRRATAVLAALLLALPGARAHAAEPDPLWEAYPLEQREDPPPSPTPAGTPTPAQREPAEPPPARSASDAGPDGGDGSLPWAALLAGAGTVGAGGAALLLLRRRRGPGEGSAPARRPGPPAPARPRGRPVAPLLPSFPREAPPSRNGHDPAGAGGGAAVAAPPRSRVRVECVIAWQPGPGGSRFRAIATSEGGASRVAGESTAFWWPASRPPILTRTTQEAHAGLVNELLSQGWRPTGAGFPWYARRFRRWEGAQDA